MSELKKYLSDSDNATRYGVSRQTVWRWVRQGKFPSPIRINGCTRWKLSDLEAWEARQEGVA
ncbi:AlpA family transcriptional regulator [Halospina denitrificans]|uniref:AlpA family transcriptional regulator n=1 Tax=Halospina denitrificans TaxID=332522 RepID=A0A4V6Q2L8_9GAMM|nr:helix-turn-helix domain-containing protein [Halospina denitrificans]TDT41498.1 AlpA family transcriptional regulator [Halospina denitrificans]